MTSESAPIRQVLIGRKRRLDRLGILTFLRNIARDRAGMHELRRLCADELRRSSIHNLRDEVVIDLLADRYVRGLLDLVEVAVPQAEPPGFDVEGSGDSPMQGPQNKPIESKPSPIVPIEYPILAGVESEQITASTTKLVAKLAELMFQMFGIDKRLSTIAETYVSVAEEEGINIARAHNALSTKIGIELHAPGPTSKPEANVPDAYIKAAEMTAEKPRGIAADLGYTLEAMTTASKMEFRRSDEAQEEAKKAEEEKAEEKKTWIEFAITFADSGEPVPSVDLVLTTPKGEEKKITTDAQGKVRLDDLPTGEFSVRSERAGKRRSETLGIGKIEGSDDAKSVAIAGTSYCIAEVKRHKVQSGETLQSVAMLVGMTAMELSTWAFGTTDSREVNRLLRHEVGCTKRGPDGNYRFDDADEPGILYLPGEWKKEGLSGGKTIALTVSRLPVKQKPWIFSM